MKLWDRLLKRNRIITMGVQAVIRDEADRVLLVRHGYHAGWHFPGGGLEPTETADDALRRELEEEVGVVPIGAPRLWGIYSHFDVFPDDHIALYLVERWERSRIPEPTFEIQEHGFFSLAALPEDVSPNTRQRLLEIEGQVARSTAW